MRRVQDQRQPSARRIAPPQHARNLETRHLAPHRLRPDRRNMKSQPLAPPHRGGRRYCDVLSSHSENAEGREKQWSTGGTLPASYASNGKALALYRGNDARKTEEFLGVLWFTV